MHKINRLTIVFLFAVLVSLPGCDWADEDEDDYQYSFKIMASSGNATGYYSINGGTFQYFDTSYSGSSIYYSFEQEISSLESILIHAEGETDATTAISIYLYDDNSIIESASVYQSVDEIVNVNLEYTASE